MKPGGATPRPRSDTTTSKYFKLFLAGLGLLVSNCLYASPAAADSAPAAPAQASGLEEAERQGDLLYFGLAGQPGRLVDLTDGRTLFAGPAGTPLEQVQTHLILDDDLILVQDLGGRWLMWNTQKNKAIGPLTAMPVVGGLRAYYRLDPGRAAFHFFRDHLTVVDLPSGHERTLPPPAHPWHLRQVKGPLFLSLAGGHLATKDLNGAPGREAPGDWRQLAFDGRNTALVLGPGPQGRPTLALCEARTLREIARHTLDWASLDYQDNLEIGFNPPGDLAYVSVAQAGLSGTWFFRAEDLHPLGRLPTALGVEFLPPGRLAAYPPAGRGQAPALCVQRPGEERPLFCLTGPADWPQGETYFNLGQGFLWAWDQGQVLTWDGGSGRAQPPLPLPAGFPRRQPPCYLGPPLPADLVCLGPARAYTAHLARGQALVHQLTPAGPREILAVPAPDAVGVYLVADAGKLAVLDRAGRVHTWALPAPGPAR
ncbi:MAG: hypothetical protein KQJ78_03095 [Deltaproteobacteria bacterium]|nr:hypothetical protein [Deltaproteobacteria bacterium]